MEIDCLSNADVYPTLTPSILRQRRFSLSPASICLRFKMANNQSTAASSSSLPDYFPFDGTCECSCDGDLTLVFDDGSSLKTHAALLKMASPTFKTMLTDCAETGTVAMEKTSREAWIFILNCLHPGARYPFSNFDPFRQTKLLVNESCGLVDVNMRTVLRLTYWNSLES